MANHITFYAYQIECLTNLHVGSGENNYGIVDKQVQRDSITNTPIINSSSLKGAIREYFEEVMAWDNKDSKLIEYFGSDKKSESKNRGNLRFIEAKLLTIPVRGLDVNPYYLACSKKHIDMFNLDCKKFNISLALDTTTHNKTEANTEFKTDCLAFTGTHPLLNGAIDMEAALYDDVFRSLPIIARNSLDNGQSSNLWYEEFVPHKSVFYFFIGVPKNCTNYKTEFEDNLLKDIIQIGANATVGYGYCKINKIS